MSTQNVPGGTRGVPGGVGGVGVNTPGGLKPSISASIPYIGTKFLCFHCFATKMLSLFCKSMIRCGSAPFYLYIPVPVSKHDLPILVFFSPTGSFSLSKLIRLLLKSRIFPFNPFWLAGAKYKNTFG